MYGPLNNALTLTLLTICEDNWSQNFVLYFSHRLRFRNWRPLSRQIGFIFIPLYVVQKLYESIPSHMLSAIKSKEASIPIIKSFLLCHNCLYYFVIHLYILFKNIHKISSSNYDFPFIQNLRKRVRTKHHFLSSL